MSALIYPSERITGYSLWRSTIFGWKCDIREIYWLLLRWNLNLHLMTVCARKYERQIMFLSKMVFIFKSAPARYDKIPPLYSTSHQTSKQFCCKKSHNERCPYPTMPHIVTIMGTCVHICVAKWCIVGYLANAMGELWGGSKGKQL